MARNLELKIKLESLSEIKQTLEENFINQTELLKQQDTYYKWDNGLLKLRSVNGKYELIKYSRDEVNKERWSDYFILNITSENAEEFFSNILTVETVVKKNRELYIYKNTRIHLDDVSELGYYLELETVVLNGLQDAKVEFDEVVKMLKLNLDNQIKASYRNLMLKK
jgi:predicted adenylyl cyclase CyaB